MKRILCTAIYLAASLPIYAASFDCTKPGLSDVEKLVCSDDNLSGLDQNMAHEYLLARSVSTKPEREELRKDQQDWLSKVRDQCTTAECLAKAYTTRMVRLNNLYSERRQSRFAEEVIARLAEDTYLSRSEVKELLMDCTSSQRVMNICSNARKISAEIEMGNVLKSLAATLPAACRSTLEAKQVNWFDRESKACGDEQTADAGGGTMGIMIYNDCLADATNARVSELRHIHSCTSIR